MLTFIEKNKLKMNTRIRVTASVLLVVVMIFLYWFAEQPAAVGLISVPFDKLVHAVMGAGLACLLWFALGSKTAGEKAGGLNILIVAVLSGLEEWHQSFLPGRVPDFYDFLAATIAASLCVLFLHMLQKKGQKIEKS